MSDLTYDAQLYFAMSDLLDRKATPEEWAGALQRFLHDQQQALPPGALKMRWISNHDTVSWTFQKKRPLEAYGADRMRALLALCALVEGVPMLYQGDEDPAIYGGKGPSSVEFLRRLYAVRNSQPARAARRPGRLRVGLGDRRGPRLPALVGRPIGPGADQPQPGGGRGVVVDSQARLCPPDPGAMR